MSPTDTDRCVYVLDGNDDRTFGSHSLENTRLAVICFSSAKDHWIYKIFSSLSSITLMEIVESHYCMPEL